MEPYNYIQNPQGSLQQGFENVLKPYMLSQQAQQAQLANQQAQQQQQVINDLMQKQQAGTAGHKDYEQATIAIPGMREHFKQAWEMHGEDEKKESLNEMTQVYSALSSGRPDLAKQVLNDRVNALKNSGAPQDRIQAVQTMADNIDASPDFVRLNTGMMLGAIGAKEAFAGTEEQRKQAEEKRKVELQPGELAKQQAELQKYAADIGLTKAQTNKAMVEAKYIPQTIAAQLGLTAAQTSKAIIDTQKTALEMANMNPEQQKQQNSLSAQQALDQAAIVLNHPGRSIGTGITSILGAVPGSEAKGFQAQLETFKAQTFIPMVSALKGMGALSDAEGKKLSASVGALDPAMPSAEFEKSLKGTIDYLYKKAKIAKLDVTNPLEKAEAIPGQSTISLPSGWRVTVR